MSPCLFFGAHFSNGSGNVAIGFCLRDFRHLGVYACEQLAQLLLRGLHLTGLGSLLAGNVSGRGVLRQVIAFGRGHDVSYHIQTVAWSQSLLPLK
jgi:hypothetical protein